MGQNQSGKPSRRVQTHTPTTPDTPNMSETSKVITVVNPKPGTKSHSTKPVELQQLDRLHKFWPILKSTLEYEYPLEIFEEGIKHEVLLSLCNRYQQHLSLCAQTISGEQRSLASRMKDIEMFSAGIAQQLAKRQEKINRTLPYLQRVNELSETLAKIQQHLHDCVPLVNRINSCLPDGERLEYFTLRPTQSTHSPPSGFASPVQSSKQEDEDEEEEEYEDEDDEMISQFSNIHRKISS